jgi:hypothetical protein
MRHHLIASLLVCAGCGSDDGATDDEPTTAADATVASMTGGGSTDEPPTNEADLVAWLQAGNYTGWAAESGVHPSTGPHFGDVRTFVNDPLIASLQAGEAPHPAGSATVKELYGSGTEVAGWSVSVKVGDGTGGDAWYWFEYYDGSTLADGIGLDICFGCHSGGTDFVLTPFPLQ